MAVKSAGEHALYLDTREAGRIIQQAQAVLNEDEFRRMMYSVYRRGGKHVKEVVAKNASKEYAVSKGAVKKTMRGPKISIAKDVDCVITMRGKRLSIGGSKGFTASGSAKGWETVTKKKKYQVRARIIRGKASDIPPHEGGAGPAFRNTAWSAGKHAFGRLQNDRLPIQSYFGIAIPQMPLNLAKPGIQNEITGYFEKRLTHELQYRIGKIR